MICFKHCRHCAVENCAMRIVDDVICDHYKPKPQTNYDKICAKSVEEMAKYMGDVQTWGGCPNHGARNCTENCADCWLDWLKQEVTEHSTT